MSNIISRLLAVTLLMLFLTPASGADVRNHDHMRSLVLEGSIELGDYDKLVKVIDESCPAQSWNRHCPISIVLASPGGSVAEAMKIGRLVRALAWGTEIPGPFPKEYPELPFATFNVKDTSQNYMCASACFFIAVAGIDRHNPAEAVLLGIHRPYISGADLRTLSAKQAMTSANEIRTAIEAYLKEMGVPSKYADLMFSIPKDQVKWISKVDFWDDFRGLIPELRDWMNARCDSRTDVEKQLDDIFDAKIKRRETFTPEEKVIWQTLAKKSATGVDCEIKVKDDLRESAWKAYRHY